MNRGILYVAFGEQYLKMTYQVIKHLKKYCSLPIHILTNIKTSDFDNVTHTVFSLHQSDNRQIKTTMIEYTPFQETLYMDCDSVVRSSKIESVFIDDLVFNCFLHWKENEKIPRIYKRALQTTNCSLPLDVVNGALIAFNKTDKVKQFFSLWNKYWQSCGKGREMPPLSCALQKSCIKHSFIPKGFFSPDVYNPNCVIQHNYNSNGGMNFFKEFNIDPINEFKPFDKNVKDDWTFV